MLNQHAPDNTRVRALGHLDDTSLRAPLAVDTHNSHQSTVTMQHLGHLMLRQKNIGATVIRNQESITILMPLNLARREARPLGQNVGALAVAQQLPFPLHRPQPALEHLLFALGNIEQFGKFNKTQGASFIGQHLSHILT